MPLHRTLCSVKQWNIFQSELTWVFSFLHGSRSWPGWPWCNLPEECNLTVWRITSFQEFSGSVLHYLQQHLVLLQPRPVIGDQQAQKEWLSEKVLSAGWFTPVWIPPGLSSNKIILINSGVRGERRATEGALCNRSKHFSGYWIPLPYCPRPLIPPSNPVLMDRMFESLLLSGAPCKLDVARNEVLHLMWLKIGDSPAVSVVSPLYRKWGLKAKFIDL